MRFRSCIMFIGVFVLMFIGTGGSIAGAQQDAGSQGSQPLMTPIDGSAGDQATDQRQSVVQRLELKMYQAAKGDLSLCLGEDKCIKQAEQIKSWVCTASSCDGTDNSKKPIDCFEGFSSKYSKDIQDKINSAACSLIQSPSAETRKALLVYFPDLGENYLVEHVAYLWALKGSPDSCEDQIKNYVGAYGPQWNQFLYRMLSGCRILAGERKREREEKDFYTWFGVLQGLNKCSDIISSEMRDACSAPGAASPVPPPVEPTGNTQ